jgi:hypothetical protein
MKTKAVLSVILFLAFLFRFTGLDWDQGHHLHPDERFLTMVATELKWPASLGEYLDPARSPLNPDNTKFKFYVYGVFPVTVVKAVSEFLVIDKYDYNNLTLVGRLLSALLELGIVGLVFSITISIFNRKTALLSAFFYALAVLPIQLAHFLAVDTFLVFFQTASFYFLIRMIQSKNNQTKHLVYMGVFYGMALASKITALYFLPLIGLGFIFLFWQKKQLVKTAFLFLIFISLSYLTFRLCDPRVFSSANFTNLSLNPNFVMNLKELRRLSSREAVYPPSVQWLSTKPIIFPLRNMVLWGFGMPMGILVIGGFFYSWWQALFQVITSKKNRPKLFVLLLMLFWVTAIFIYQGIQFVKAMRYFYPLYPFLVIFAARFIGKLKQFLKKKLKQSFYLPFAVGSCFILLIYPLSFISIYLKPHSRVQASDWIYNNVPKKSTLSCEHWDDCLPVAVDEKNPMAYHYQTETLELYYEDKPSKWWKIDNQLEKIDYLVMSSNRLWGSIPKVPDRYPRTARFYNDLFAEKLDFTKAAEITSYPCFPPIGKPLFCFSDKNADESFTVYDHPQILIYQKRSN